MRVLFLERSHCVAQERPVARIGLVGGRLGNGLAPEGLLHFEARDVLLLLLDEQALVLLHLDKDFFLGLQPFERLVEEVFHVYGRQTGLRLGAYFVLDIVKQVHVKDLVRQLVVGAWLGGLLLCFRFGPAGQQQRGLGLGLPFRPEVCLHLLHKLRSFISSLSSYLYCFCPRDPHHRLSRDFLRTNVYQARVVELHSVAL